MSFTGAASDHELETKVAKYPRGHGADLEFVDPAGQEVERPAHCREATTKTAAQHHLAQQIETLDPGSPAEPTGDEAIVKLFPTGDQAVVKLFLERYKGSPPPNVIEALTTLGRACKCNESSRRGNVTVAEEEVEEEDE